MKPLNTPAADADPNQVRRLPIRAHLHVHFAASRQTARQSQVELIQPHKTALRPGVKYRRIDAAYPGLDRFNRAVEADSRAEKNQKNLIALRA